MGEPTQGLKSPTWLHFCDDVLSQLPDALLITDADGVITRVNRAAEVLFGAQERLLIGKRYDAPAIFGARGWRLVRADFEGNPLDQPPPHPVEDALTYRETYENALFILERGQFGRTYLGADAIPLLTELGGVAGVALIYRDMTEEQGRRSEAEWLRRDLVRATQDVEELLRLSEALNDVNDVVHATLDAGEVLQEVLRRAALALRAQSGSIDLCGTEGWARRVVFGFPPETIGRRLTDAEAAHDALVADGRGPLIVADTDEDDRFDRELLRRLRIRSLLAVPLLARSEVTGVLSFYRPRPGRFVPEQASFASKVAATTGLALENARVYAEERHIAETLQQALLVLPDQVPGVRSAHFYQSATEAAYVGGDFFDLFQLQAASIGIVIGDVSGKGVEASGLASFTRQLLRAHASEGLTPAQIVEHTNELVYRASRTEDFVTLFIGILSVPDGSLTFCNAGHPTPIICSDGRAEMLEDGGPLTGAWGELHWEDHTTHFGPGDLLVLYTDGLIEAKRDGELFGEERLIRLVQSIESAPLEDVGPTVLREVRSFARGKLQDDVALLLISPT